MSKVGRSLFPSRNWKTPNEARHVWGARAAQEEWWIAKTRQGGLLKTLVPRGDKSIGWGWGQVFPLKRLLAQYLILTIVLPIRRTSTIIIFWWDWATNFQILSNRSTVRSRAVQSFKTCSMDLSPSNLQRTSFHEDDFTMTSLSPANNVKHFFPMSNDSTSFYWWVWTGERALSHFNSWCSVAISRRLTWVDRAPVTVVRARLLSLLKCLMWPTR